MTLVIGEKTIPASPSPFQDRRGCWYRRGGEGGGWFEFIINGIVIIRREDKSWERRKSQEWRERGSLWD